MASSPAARPAAGREARADGANPYVRALPPDDAAIYEAAPADADLANEIKMLRLIISLLSVDLGANHPHVVRAISTLCRVLHLQSSQMGAASSIEQDILKLTAVVLNHKQSQAVEG